MPPFKRAGTPLFLMVPAMLSLFLHTEPVCQIHFSSHWACSSELQRHPVDQRFSTRSDSTTTGHLAVAGGIFGHSQLGER